MSWFEINLIHFNGGDRHGEKLVSYRGNAYMLYYRSNALPYLSLDERNAMLSCIPYALRIIST